MLVISVWGDGVGCLAKWLFSSFGSLVTVHPFSSLGVAFSLELVGVLNLAPRLWQGAITVAFSWHAWQLLILMPSRWSIQQIMEAYSHGDRGGWHFPALSCGEGEDAYPQNYQLATFQPVMYSRTKRNIVFKQMYSLPAGQVVQSICFAWYLSFTLSDLKCTGHIRCNWSFGSKDYVKQCSSWPCPKVESKSLDRLINWVFSICLWKYSSFKKLFISLSACWRICNPKIGAATGMPVFSAPSFTGLYGECIFYQSKVCGSPGSSKSAGAACPTAVVTLSLCVTFW